MQLCNTDKNKVFNLPILCMHRDIQNRDMKPPIIPIYCEFLCVPRASDVQISRADVAERHTIAAMHHIASLIGRTVSCDFYSCEYSPKQNNKIKKHFF